MSQMSQNEPKSLKFKRPEKELFIEINFAIILPTNPEILMYESSESF